MELSIIQTTDFEFWEAWISQCFPMDSIVLSNSSFTPNALLLGLPLCFWLTCLLGVNHSAILTCPIHASGNLWLLKNQIKQVGYQRDPRTCDSFCWSVKCCMDESWMADLLPSPPPLWWSQIFWLAERISLNSLFAGYSVDVFVVHPSKHFQAVFWGWPKVRILTLCQNCIPIT